MARSGAARQVGIRARSIAAALNMQMPRITLSDSRTRAAGLSQRIPYIYLQLNSQASRAAPILATTYNLLVLDVA